MRRNNRIDKIREKRRTGFSLVELVITIVIIAVLSVAVFAGGSAATKKAQVNRATSDLHNFDIAMQTYMFSNRTPVNLSILSPKEDFNKVVDGVNQLLPKDYILKATTLPLFLTTGFL